MNNIEVKYINGKKSNVIDVNDKSENDVLISVEIQFSMEQNGIVAELNKEINLDYFRLSDDFVKLEDVSDEQKVQWALSQMSEKQWFGIDWNLKRQIKLKLLNVDNKLPKLQSINQLKK